MLLEKNVSLCTGVKNMPVWSIFNAKMLLSSYKTIIYSKKSALRSKYNLGYI